MSVLQLRNRVINIAIGVYMARVNKSIFDRARANAKLASERVEKEIEEAGGIKQYRKKRASKTPEARQLNIFQAASKDVEQIPASDS